MDWLIFALMTVFCWGLYGVFLSLGRGNMHDPSPQNGLFKAFLFVGVAYFITAILAPVGMLVSRGADWRFSGAGMGLSLAAGVLGAVGAFGVLLAFSKGGTPGVVMAIVFGAAPVVNAVAATAIYGLRPGLSIKDYAPFALGILLVGAGAFLVTRFNPAKPPSHSPAQVQQPQ